MPDFSDHVDATTRPKVRRQQRSDTSQERNQRIRKFLKQDKDVILDAPSESQQGSKLLEARHKQIERMPAHSNARHPYRCCERSTEVGSEDDANLFSHARQYAFSIHFGSKPHVSKHKKTPAGLVLVGVSSGGASGA